MLTVVVAIALVIAVVVEPAVFAGIVDLQNAGLPVAFQLANGSFPFIAAEVAVVSNGLDLGIIRPVHLVNLILPVVVAGRIISRIGGIATVVATAENHVAAVAVTAIFGDAVVVFAQNDAAALIAELSVCSRKGAAGHQECKNSFHSAFVLPCVSKKNASLAAEE